MKGFEKPFPSAGSSRHRNQLQGHVNPELLHQWYLWEDCQRDLISGQVHQEAHSDIQRNSDSSQACAPWWVGKARRLWGLKGCHKIHFLSEFKTKQHLVILITTNFWSRLRSLDVVTGLSPSQSDSQDSKLGLMRFLTTSSVVHVISLCFMHFVSHEDARAPYGLVFRHRRCISAPISLFSKPQALLNRPVQMEYEHDSRESIKLCMLKYFTFWVKAWPTTSAFSDPVSGRCTFFQNKTIIQSSYAA